jgi:hypothetical protein
MPWLGTADNRSTPSLVGQASGGVRVFLEGSGTLETEGHPPETVLIAEKGKPWLPQ